MSLDIDTPGSCYYIDPQTRSLRAVCEPCGKRTPNTWWSDRGFRPAAKCSKCGKELGRAADEDSVDLDDARSA